MSFLWECRADKKWSFWQRETARVVDAEELLIQKLGIAKRREGEKERRLNAYFERPSMRSICRIVKVSRPTLAKWLKRTLANPELTDTLAPAERKDVLEWDEAWSFVKCRSARRWLWIALCRRTWQVVAYVIGNRMAFVGYPPEDAAWYPILFACVIVFVPCATGIFYTLCINDTKARFDVATLFCTHLANLSF